MCLIWPVSGREGSVVARAVFTEFLEVTHAKGTAGGSGRAVRTIEPPGTGLCAGGADSVQTAPREFFAGGALRCRTISPG
jgi:hypothetical protein